jgi:hypothetical protein
MRNEHLYGRSQIGGSFQRRLSDKILLAFHAACDQRDHETAKSILEVLEYLMATKCAGENRDKIADGLVAAHERLWNLRN